MVLSAEQRRKDNAACKKAAYDREKRQALQRAHAAAAHRLQCIALAVQQQAAELMEHMQSGYEEEIIHLKRLASVSGPVFDRLLWRLLARRLSTPSGRTIGCQISHALGQADWKQDCAVGPAVLHARPHAQPQA